MKEADVIVIGGGATGLGVAWDSATRGLSVLLLEGGDFSSGTSSRSTKLIHGGIRYLRQGHFGLVRESLKERAWLLSKAPESVHSLRFVIPCRSWIEQATCRLGTAIYDGLGGGPNSHWLGRRDLQQRLPGLQNKQYRGGVDYWDAQFDDSRLAIGLLRQILYNGGLALNYLVVEALELEGERIRGVTAFDKVSRTRLRFRSRMVVNAAGVYSDRIRRMSRPKAEHRIRASRGSHLVIRGDCLGSRGDALIIPRTPDGRVVFLIPWLGQTLLGTTEIPVDDVESPPLVSGQEVDYLLSLANSYLARPLSRADVTATFSGYRPLISKGGDQERTSTLSRDFEIEETAPGLLSVLGGKWTTFRAMAEATVDRIEKLLNRPGSGCRTLNLSLNGTLSALDPPQNWAYHRQAPLEGFPYTWGQVYRAIHDEMAVTLEDVLARRLRCLFLDVEASHRIAPEIARVMAAERGEKQAWIEQELENFRQAARQYQVPS